MDWTKTTEEDESESISRSPEPQESIPTPVEDVRDVSGSIEEALHNAGYERLIDLQTATDEALKAVEGVSAQRVQLSERQSDANRQSEFWIVGIYDTNMEASVRKTKNLSRTVE